MIPLDPGAHVHLIAACGTAMGSLAGLLRERGFRVTGSDAHVYPPMSDFLREQGIDLVEGFDPVHVQNPRPDLVVIGNVVSRGNPELEATLAADLPYTSLPEAIRDLFLVDRRSLVVTGTHGKTTTTAMIAHLLRGGGGDPSFLIAGLPRNFPRPFHLGRDRWFVIEGDEYDSAYFAKQAKFLFYRPQVLILNNVEFDHADIYRDLEDVVQSFRQVVNQVPKTGVIIANGDDDLAMELADAAFCPVQTVGMDHGHHWSIRCIEADAEGQSFELAVEGESVCKGRLGLSGEHNVRNAVTSLAACAWTGAKLEALLPALTKFSGVRRRQEQLGEVGGILLFDDFAHHPTAVEKTLAGLRAAHPRRRLWAVFEPASATNARATFEERYLQSFAAADNILIAPVPHPERRGADPGFFPSRLAQGLADAGKRAWTCDHEGIVSYLREHAVDGDVIVFMSNGNFGGVQGQALRALSQDRVRAPH
ncbi:MAG: UDP-N-acetylmuramate:L-alanyl-gamma-D-glutamyl-meso-diaminopimelate ligase [Candidatus Latescibacterota bacterium]|nr:UDP-N-acetylmuramate:L-alanyl-gamma-D-glutamyl-meso-diaminopimelate ligase [Candidatus Latescibacterota bacterium]